MPDMNFDGELTNINQQFRKNLDLYANVVKVRSLNGVPSKHKNIDLVIIREQTEGEYSALEHESVKGLLILKNILELIIIFLGIQNCNRTV